MLCVMSRRLIQLVTFVFLLVALFSPLPSSGQVSTATTELSRPVEVSIEVRVLGIPASGLSELGLVLPDAPSGLPDSPMGFAVVLPGGEAKTLVANSRAKSVHSRKLQGAPGTPLTYRVETRAQANPNSPAENPPYFVVGMVFEITPTVVSNRNIALSTASVLQIRRGGGSSSADPAPVVFETRQAKREIQIPEGKSILLGGFLTASNSSGLPVVPMIADNPILGYVLSKSPRQGNDPEIVVLLTPTLLGAIDPGVKITSTTPPPPEPVVKLDVPVVASSPVLLSNATPKSELFAVSPPSAILNLPPAAPPVVSVPTVPAPVASPPVPQPSPKPSPPQVRFYTLQVGAFGSAVNAIALAAELKLKFEGVFVDEAGSGSTPYRVRVGRVSRFTAAQELQTETQGAGF